MFNVNASYVRPCGKMSIQTSDDLLRAYGISGKNDLQITGAITNDKEDDSFLVTQACTHPETRTRCERRTARLTILA